MNSQQSHTCHQHGLCIRWRAVAPSFPLCWGAWPSLNQQYLAADDRRALQVWDHWWERTWLCGSLWTNTWRSCTMQECSRREWSTANLMEKPKLGEVDNQWESFVNGAAPILLDGCHVKAWPSRDLYGSWYKTKHMYSIQVAGTSIGPNSNDFSHVKPVFWSWLFGPLTSPAVMIPTRQLEQKVPVKDCPTSRAWKMGIFGAWKTVAKSKVPPETELGCHHCRLNPRKKNRFDVWKRFSGFSNKKNLLDSWHQLVLWASTSQATQVVEEGIGATGASMVRSQFVGMRIREAHFTCWTSSYHVLLYTLVVKHLSCSHTMYMLFRITVQIMYHVYIYIYYICSMQTK